MCRWRTRNWCPQRKAKHDFQPFTSWLWLYFFIGTFHWSISLPMAKWKGVPPFLLLHFQWPIMLSGARFFLSMIKKNIQIIGNGTIKCNIFDKFIMLSDLYSRDVNSWGWIEKIWLMKLAHSSIEIFSVVYSGNIFKIKKIFSVLNHSAQFLISNYFKK